MNLNFIFEQSERNCGDEVLYVKNCLLLIDNSKVIRCNSLKVSIYAITHIQRDDFIAETFKRTICDYTMFDEMRIWKESTTANIEMMTLRQAAKKFASDGPIVVVCQQKLKYYYIVI